MTDYERLRRMTEASQRRKHERLDREKERREKLLALNAADEESA